MKSKKYEVTTQLEITYDENSSEFLEAFDSYKDCIDRSASVNNMLAQVAWYVCRFGGERMVEGVGFVWMDGKEKPTSNYSGIRVSIEEAEVH